MAEATKRVLEEVSEERARQRAKWGEQELPDGTGGRRREEERDGAQILCDLRAATGSLAWRHILEEEVAEALAETDPAALRAELLQVAAVAVQWIEAIDRRA